EGPGTSAWLARDSNRTRDRALGRNRAQAHGARVSQTNLPPCPVPPTARRPCSRSSRHTYLQRWPSGWVSTYLVARPTHFWISYRTRRYWHFIARGRVPTCQQPCLPVPSRCQLEKDPLSFREILRVKQICEICQQLFRHEF